MKRLLPLMLLCFCLTCFAQDRFKPILGDDEPDWSNPLNRGLGADWLLNERGGSLARDGSGNENHGTIAGATWDEGPFGPCLSCDGITGRVESALVSPAPPFTVCAWVRPAVIDADQTVLYIGDGASGSAIDAYLLQLDTSGHALATAWRGSLGGSATSTTALAVGRWYHLAAVFTAANLRDIYVNGVWEATSTASESVNALPSATVRIGCSYFAEDGTFYSGGIDNPIVVYRALTAAEIVQLYRDPWQRYRTTSQPEYYVSGGAPPATPHTQVIFVSGLPVWIVLFFVGVCVADMRSRRRAA